jgi:hypothetical protein
MWERYAAAGTGFVLSFDTDKLLPSDGILGKVDYSDEPIQTFLRHYGLQAFFRKTNRWLYETEWRYVRMLDRCLRDGIDAAGLPIYLLEFQPHALKGIFIRQHCAIEWQLRLLLATDCRFRHVKLVQF